MSASSPTARFTSRHAAVSVSSVNSSPGTTLTVGRGRVAKTGRMAYVAMLIVAGMLALAACGAAGSATARLAPSAGLRVARANVALARYCVDRLSGTGMSGGISEIDRAFESIQALVEVFRANPRAIYRPGGKGPARTMRQVLADEANALDSCDPEDAHHLDRALAAG